MAIFRVTVPDAALDRIKAAYGYNAANPELSQPATLAQIEASLKATIRQRVEAHEIRQAAANRESALAQESW